MPQISVIVPVYKVEPYLRRCVDSILAQSFADFNLILVDDGSPDNCPAICDEYAEKDSRINVIHQNNCGLSAARNTGINWVFAYSDSQWLTFIDSDDWIPRRYLELLHNAATIYNVQISMCWLLPTTGEAGKIDDNILPVLRSPEEAYTCNGKEISAFAQGRLYHKNCFETHRFAVGKLFEDTYLTYKLLFRQTKIAVIESPLYYYYLNDAGIVRSPWTVKKIDDLYDAMEEQVRYFRSNGYLTAENMQIRNYLCGINTLYRNLCENKRANKDLLITLKRKIKKNFRHFAKRLSLDNELDAWVVTQIYPKTMWCYWHIKAVMTKLVH